jgi:5-(carboxyamino)imidazole ribonucleotide mutase
MLVQVVMGSKSDLNIGKRVISILEKLEIPYNLKVASAHRTPELVDQIASGEADVFIAVAGMSAALPGAIASKTQKPVIGVPVSGKVNLDSILSIIQMPKGVPVAAVGLDQGENAALLAAEMLALGNDKLNDSITKFKEELKQNVIKSNKNLKKLIKT